MGPGTLELQASSCLGLSVEVEWAAMAMLRTKAETFRRALLSLAWKHCRNTLLRVVVWDCSVSSYLGSWSPCQDDNGEAMGETNREADHQRAFGCDAGGSRYEPETRNERGGMIQSGNECSYFLFYFLGPRVC